MPNGNFDNVVEVGPGQEISISKLESSGIRPGGLHTNNSLPDDLANCTTWPVMPLLRFGNVGLRPTDCLNGVILLTKAVPQHAMSTPTPVTVGYKIVDNLLILC